MFTKVAGVQRLLGRRYPYKYRHSEFLRRKTLTLSRILAGLR